MDNILTVTSPAFKSEGIIPIEYTGYGEDRSPELRLSPLPGGTAGLAVIMDDLDHPVPAYSHWVIWNLPAAGSIPGNIPHGARVEGLGAVQGRGYGKNRYRGPKPPFNWSHRYRYAVYALDAPLDLPANARKRDLQRAMEGHVLAEGELIGRYR